MSSHSVVSHTHRGLMIAAPALALTLLLVTLMPAQLTSAQEANNPPVIAGDEVVSLEFAEMQATRTMITVPCEKSRLIVNPRYDPVILDLIQNMPCEEKRLVTTPLNVGPPLIATDLDGDDITWTLEGVNTIYFAISDGQITTTKMFDYEGDPQTTYNFTARASDGDLSDTVTVIVLITDVNEPPKIVSDGGGDTFSFTITENTPSGTNVGTALVANDVDGDTTQWILEEIQYHEGKDGPDDFRIINGQIITDAVVNFEDGDLRKFAAKVSDGTLHDLVHVTVKILNEEETPDAPGRPTVSAASSTSLMVSWTAPNNPGQIITEYVVEHREQSGNWSRFDINHPAMDATSANITGLDADTTYQVRIKASNSDKVWSDWSSIGSGATAPAQPNAPQHVSVNAVSPYTLNVTWSEPSGNADVYHYQMQYKLSTDTEWQYHGNMFGNTHDTSTNISGLEPGTTYHVKVRAVGLETGPWSSTSMGTTNLGQPNAPQHVSVSAESSTNLNVIWSAPSGNGWVNDYEVWYKASSDTTWTTYGMTGGNTTTVISNLDAGTAYNIKVRAVGLETGPWSSTSTGTTYPAQPNAPRSLSVSTASSMSLDVSWREPSGNADVNYYELRYKQSTDTDWKYYGIIYDTSVVMDELGPDTAYNVQVKAVGLKDGPWSSTSTGTTAPAQPNAPQSLSVTITSTSSLNLTWNEPSGKAWINYYEVRFKQSTADWKHHNSPSTNTTTVLWDLDEGATYTIQVRAVGLEYGPWSSSVSTTTMSEVEPEPLTTTFITQQRTTLTDDIEDVDQPTKTPTISTYPDQPGAPQSISVSTASSTSLDVSWRAPSGIDFSKYKLWYDVNYKNTTDTKWEGTGTESTSITIDGLDAGTTYQVKVMAHGLEKGPWSSTSTGTTAPAQPNAPRSISVSAASATTLDVSWREPSGNTDVYHYQVQYKLSTDTEWRYHGNMFGNTHDTSTNISGLEPNTTYNVKVRAVGLETGPWSSTSTGTTYPAQPNAPRSISVSAISSTGLDVAWRAPSGNAWVDDYEIWYKISSNTKWKSNGNTNFTSTEIWHLEGGTTYHVKVRAVGLETGPWSSTSTGTTAPAQPNAPRSISVSTASSMSLDVSWREPSGNADVNYYELRYKQSTDTDWEYYGIIYDTSVVIDELGPDTAYNVQVKAVGLKDGPWSSTSTGTTAPAQPNAPRSLSVTIISTNSLNLTWNEPSGKAWINSYEVRFKQSTADYWKHYNSPNTNTTTILWDLDEDATYTIQVRAVGLEYGPWSSSVSATTLSVNEFELLTTTIITQQRTTLTDDIGYEEGPTQSPSQSIYPGQPGAPRSLSVSTASSTSLDVSWRTPSGIDVSKYKLWYDVNYKNTTDTKWKSQGTESTSITIDGLDASTTYQVKVKAHGLEKGPWSSTSTGTTAPAQPNAPRSLSVSAASATSLDVSWREPSGNANVYHYIVQFKQSDATDWRYHGNMDGHTFGTSTNIGGLDANTAYNVRVKAVGLEDGSWSLTRTTTTNSAQPNAPRSLSVSAISSTSLDVSWREPSGNADVYKYEVQYKESTDTDWKFYDNIYDTSTIITYLDGGTAYHVQVRAIGLEDGPWSSTGTGTTYPAQPNAPRSLSVNVTSHNSLDVSWREPSGNADVYKYEVQYKESTDTDWKPYNIVDDTSAVVSGLAEDTIYDVKVRAVGLEMGPWSSSVSATTPPKDGETSKITETSQIHNLTSGQNSVLEPNPTNNTSNKKAPKISHPLITISPGQTYDLSGQVGNASFTITLQAIDGLPTYDSTTFDSDEREFCAISPSGNDPRSLNCINDGERQTWQWTVDDTEHPSGATNNSTNQYVSVGSVGSSNSVAPPQVVLKTPQPLIAISPGQTYDLSGQVGNASFTITLRVTNNLPSYYLMTFDAEEREFCDISHWRNDPRTLTCTNDGETQTWQWTVADTEHQNNTSGVIVPLAQDKNSNSTITLSVGQTRELSGQVGNNNVTITIRTYEGLPSYLPASFDEAESDICKISAWRTDPRMMTCTSGGETLTWIWTVR